MSWLRRNTVQFIHWLDTLYSHHGPARTVKPDEDCIKLVWWESMINSIITLCVPVTLEFRQIIAKDNESRWILLNLFSTSNRSRWILLNLFSTINRSPHVEHPTRIVIHIFRNVEIPTTLVCVWLTRCSGQVEWQPNIIQS